MSFFKKKSDAQLEDKLKSLETRANRMQNRADLSEKIAVQKKRIWEAKKKDPFVGGAFATAKVLGKGLRESNLAYEVRKKHKRQGQPLF